MNETNNNKQQGDEKVKEVKTFQVSKTLASSQLCAAAGRRWGVKAEELCIFEDKTFISLFLLFPFLYFGFERK